MQATLEAPATQANDQATPAQAQPSAIDLKVERLSKRVDAIGAQIEEAESKHSAARVALAEGKGTIEAVSATRSTVQTLYGTRDDLDKDLATALKKQTQERAQQARALKLAQMQALAHECATAQADLEAGLQTLVREVEKMIPTLQERYRVAVEARNAFVGVGLEIEPTFGKSSGYLDSLTYKPAYKAQLEAVDKFKQELIEVLGADYDAMTKHLVGTSCCAIDRRQATFNGLPVGQGITNSELINGTSTPFEQQLRGAVYNAIRNWKP